MGAKHRDRVIVLFTYFPSMGKKLETGNETAIENVNYEPVTGIRYGNRRDNMDIKRNVNLGGTGY